jgi:geranylgeranyl diphosphate synthase type II
MLYFQNFINQAIEEFFSKKLLSLDKTEISEKELLKACYYAVSIGGKRIRPVLSVLCYEAITHEKFPPKLLPVVLSLEFIHAYSLVHDDLPALDNDELRRGHPTLWKKFGEDVAILVGDALQSLAYEVILESVGISADQKVQMLHILTQKSGAMQGMIAGQMRDIQSEKPLSLKTLILTHQKKTGALIEAACLLGGILAQTDQKNLQKLSQYASHMGLAFQIKDDLLDLCGKEEVIGKKCQKDQNSKGFIFFMGEKETKHFLKREIDKAQKMAQELSSTALVDMAVFIKNREQ